MPAYKRPAARPTTLSASAAPPTRIAPAPLVVVVVVAALPDAVLEAADVSAAPLPDADALVPVELELVFSAAAWKASKLLEAVGLIANTMPFWQ